MADITAPWAAGTAGALAGTVRHVIEVRANHPSWAEPIPLDLETGTILYDENQVPHVTAQMTLKTSPGFDLDPRLGIRIEIDAGYIVNGVRDVHRMADLWLWEYTDRRPSNLIDLLAYSMESRIMGWMPLGGSGQSFSSTSLAGDSITSLLHWALPSAVVVNDMHAATFVTGGAFLNVGTGDNVWSAIYDIADRAGGGWVYEDGLGVWHVTDRPEAAGQSAAILKTGVGGTITRHDTEMSLERWYNAVLVEHSWYDGEQRTAQGWAEITSGPLRVAAVGRRVLKVTREYKGDSATARSSASSIVARTVTRGRGVALSIGGAPYWVRPGATVTIQVGDAPQERQLISSIQFSLAATGTANIVTRLPEDVTITTGA